MLFPRSLACLLMVLSLTASLYAEDRPEQLQNPDFEEDADNVGYPDGWTVSPDAEVTLTSEAVSGRRALVIKNGYAAVSQNLNLEGLAGRRVALSLDACSPDGAKLGVRVGFYVHDEGKGKVWVDAPLIWEKPLKTEYQSFTGTRVIPENALDGRFWICLYRSNGEGTVIIDNVILEFVDDLSSLSTKETIVLQREKEYFLGKLSLASSREPGKPEWSSLRTELDALMNQARNGTAFLQTLSALQGLNARLLAALYPNEAFVAEWTDAFERLNPESLPAPGEKNWKITALPGEVASLGVEIANTTTESQTVSVRINGAVAAAGEFEVRRQVLMETWYTKGATLVADPLPLLPISGESWQLTLEPGETTRLYVSLKINAASSGGPLEGTLSVNTSASGKELPFNVTVIPQAPPVDPPLAHYQFLYTNMNVAAKDPVGAKDDLEAHGVTDIEWAFMPAAVFSPDGKLLDVKWGSHDRWLAGFKDSRIRLNIFWLKRLKTADGGELAFLSPQWKRGWKEILTAYLDHAASLGLPRERFTILPMDEIHSKNYQDAPDQNIADFIEVVKATAEAEPRLPRYLTIGNYAFPADIEAVVSYLDVAMPHWPRPEKLSRNAPADYKPREDYYAKTLPLLKKARETRGLQIWSYHVKSGKSDDLLKYSRAYPFLAVAADLTGFGYWAYNVSSESTWDDMDGKILDYCFIYDGTENHPLNTNYNPTGEKIVPSLRWEAVRAGQQDGQILLYLTSLEKSEACPEALRKEIGDLTGRIREIGGEFGYGGDGLTYEAVRAISTQLREIYGRARAGADTAS